MNRRMEIRVGITVIVALAILIVSIGTFSTYAKARLMRLWHVRFEQAGGLGEGDQVMVNGIRKGAVKNIRLADDHVVVDLGLPDELTLTKDSRVAIRNVGMMGEKVIAVDLRMGGGAWSTRDTIPGDYEKGITEVMAEIGGLVSSVREMSRQIDHASTAFSKDGGMGRTVENFRHTSEQLRLAVDENRAALKATLDNFAVSSQTVKGLTAEREAQLRETLDHFAAAARNLDALSVRLDSTRVSLQSVAGKLDHGQGSLGRLVNDDKLYADLNSSVKSLKNLIEDVKANPKRYFRFSVF